MMRFLVTLILIFFPLTAQAQNLPKFDGVYVGLSDGSFVKLPRVNFTSFSLCEYGVPSPPNTGNSGIRYVEIPALPQYRRQFGFLTEEAFSNLPEFKMGALDSLLVKGRDEKIERVTAILLSDQFFEKGIFQDGTVHQIHRGDTARCTSAINSSELGSLKGTKIKLQIEGNLLKYIHSDCGWNAESFDIVSDVPNALQYFASHPGFIRTFIYESAFNACGTQRNVRALAVGRVVKTNKGLYAYRLE